MNTRIKTVKRPAHHIEVGDVIWGTYQKTRRWMPVEEIKTLKRTAKLRPYGGFEFYTGDDTSLGIFQHHDEVKVCIVEQDS